jgi:5,10-methylene-tetrahydrofolate dehydrogenase/methenyl tetrahydrofolate cyclohydrolase
MKKQACDHIGIEYIGIDLSDAATQDEIEGAVQELNDNPKVNGILV